LVNSELNTIKSFNNTYKNINKELKQKLESAELEMFNLQHALQDLKERYDYDVSNLKQEWLKLQKDADERYNKALVDLQSKYATPLNKAGHIYLEDILEFGKIAAYGTDK
jgi:hypothetical protein